MATLTITLTEAVSLGDGSTDRGTTNVHTETVNEVDHRIMDVGTGYVDIIKFGAAASAGTFKDNSVQYLRITNLDASGNRIENPEKIDRNYDKINNDHFNYGKFCGYFSVKYNGY